MSALEELWAAGAPVYVISDIHANERALEAVIDYLPPDAGVVCLGDLLTFGPAPKAVMASLLELLRQRPSVLVAGNHDQLYLDLQKGEQSYYDRLPEWIRESVDWTAERIDLDSFASLPWRQDCQLAPVLLQHANPYTYGDWSYVRSEEEHARAAARVAERGLQIGIFGHTHRARLFFGAQQRFRATPASVVVKEDEGPVIGNSGAVGQPRGETLLASLVSLEQTQLGVLVAHHWLHYPVEEHLSSLQASGMSQSTVEKLISFYTGGDR